MAPRHPFYSLTPTDQQALAQALSQPGTSIRSAAHTLGLHYRHCLNFAHTHGLVPPRPTPPADTINRAVDRVAAGSTLTQAARDCGISISAVFNAARAAGVHQPRPMPRGAAATTRRVEYLTLRLSALTRTDAAAACGISPRTALDFDKGVTKTGTRPRTRFIPTGADAAQYNRLMTALLTHHDVIEPGRQPDPANHPTIDPYRRIHPRYLSLAERETIADLRREGWSMRAIAGHLGRSPSTISRELANNRSADGPYRPIAAARKAAARRLRPKQPKIAGDAMLAQLIQTKLDLRWSPEQIAAWLRRAYPHAKEWHVCHETIYQALYVQARGGLKKQVAAALRTGRARRVPNGDPAQRRRRFVDDMIMISQRPADVEDRAVPGHWEGDLILGAANKSAIATLVERTTRYVILVHLPAGHGATAVRDGLTAAIGSLPTHLRGSLTWDQGSEMAGHKQFSVAAECPVYFCDPASPWQRGTNENTNGLLRQYFPKGTDLSAHSPEDLEFVAQQLNGRPRKTLGWDTPAQRMSALLDAS